ncbi:hypothetical protein FRC05_002620 [Tulasnella sp. 425]|nr:hypothetical protein FRC05_002620 [Tulasnella sp. 425]
MASQSGEHNELDFTGESAEKAESFVQAVHRRAFAAGRQKENAWIAEFACTCFSKKALRWYDTLDAETQNDWKLLRRAILGEYTASPPAPATVPSAAPALVGSPSSTTPAAPPPSAVTMKIGRIRIDSEDHTKRRYLWTSTDDDEEAAVPKKKAAPRKEKAAADGDDVPKPKKTRAPAKKKAKKVEVEDEDSAEEVKWPSDWPDDGEQDSEDQEKPKAKGKAKAKPAPKKKAPAKKKKKAESDYDDEE